MPLAKQMRAGLVASAALAVLPTAAAAAPAPPHHGGGEATLMQALLHSRVLWATIDVCSPADQPNYVGVRGSMPGDKHPQDKMYMRFRLQYMDATKKRWIDLASAKSPNYVYVGPGSSVRQGGRSFQLVPRTGKPTVSMRGVV